MLHSPGTYLVRISARPVPLRNDVPAAASPAREAESAGMTPNTIGRASSETGLPEPQTLAGWADLIEAWAGASAALSAVGLLSAAFPLRDDAAHFEMGSDVRAGKRLQWL
jgi:hypothetical protein